MKQIRISSLNQSLNLVEVSDLEHEYKTEAHRIRLGLEFALESLRSRPSDKDLSANNLFRDERNTRRVLGKCHMEGKAANKDMRSVLRLWATGT